MGRERGMAREPVVGAALVAARLRILGRETGGHKGRPYSLYE